ncbi:unnamed protein product [Pedinophyceae sp. YPF-701]|nr:unnamed protein product [Pedinophyceae sp. YPF-701]
MQGQRGIMRMVDDRVVIVLDPEDDSRGNGPYGHRAGPHRTRGALAQGIKNREKRYVFDRAYDGEASNQHVYRHTVAGLIPGVLQGWNATCFAYGATGSGKTYTMVGSQEDPGLMVLSLQGLFRLVREDGGALNSVPRSPSTGGDGAWTISCSYLEVYNEVIYDLLIDSSPPLELREDPELGAVVANLNHVTVESVEDIFKLLTGGNARRKTESTDMNATSSRSHAVLEISITRTTVNHYKRVVHTGRLSLVDLAGSERASDTNNRGQQLKDGANINRSLLALAECIHALGRYGKRRGRKGDVFVPFRNSKLTRILKEGLCGNSRTAMIATVSPADGQYAHSINTLKWANRAKEIKTHVRRNNMTVDAHISEYQRMIDALREENRELKAALRGSCGAPAATFESQVARMPNTAATPAARASSCRSTQQIAVAIRGNAKERRAQQQALLQVEELVVRSRQEADEVRRELDALDAAGLPKNSALHVQLSRQCARAEEQLRDATRSRIRLTKELNQLDEDHGMLLGTSRARGVSEQVASQVLAGSQEVQGAQDALLLDAYCNIILEQQHVIQNLWHALEATGASRGNVLRALVRTGMLPMDRSALGEPPEPASGVPRPMRSCGATSGQQGWSGLDLESLVDHDSTGQEERQQVLAATGGRLDRYMSGMHAMERYISLRDLAQGMTLRAHAAVAHAGFADVDVFENAWDSTELQPAVLRTVGSGTSSPRSARRSAPVEALQSRATGARDPFRAADEEFWLASPRKPPSARQPSRHEASPAISGASGSGLPLTSRPGLTRLRHLHLQDAADGAACTSLPALSPRQMSAGARRPAQSLLATAARAVPEDAPSVRQGALRKLMRRRQGLAAPNAGEDAGGTEPPGVRAPRPSSSRRSHLLHSSASPRPQPLQASVPAVTAAKTDGKGNASGGADSAGRRSNVASLTEDAAATSRIEGSAAASPASSARGVAVASPLARPASMRPEPGVPAVAEQPQAVNGDGGAREVAALGDDEDFAVQATVNGAHSRSRPVADRAAKLAALRRGTAAATTTQLPELHQPADHPPRS